MWKISLRYIPLKANEWVIGPAGWGGGGGLGHTHLAGAEQARPVASYGERTALSHDGLPVFSVESF